MGLDHKQPLQLDKIRDGFRDRSTHINLADDWWVAEDTILQEAAQQRTSRFAAKKNCQKLVSGLDWTVARLAQRKLSATQSAHIRSWTQAAIHYKHGDKPKPCPLCHVPTTPKHIIWLCKWHHQQAHEALPVSWTERLQDPLEEWIPKEAEDHLTQPLPLQGHSCWQSLEPLRPWPHLSRQTSTGLGFRVLRSHLFSGHLAQERNHHRHATGLTDD